MKNLMFLSKEGGGGIESYLRQINKLLNRQKYKFIFLFFKKNNLTLPNKIALQDYYPDSTDFILIRFFVFLILFIKLFLFIQRNKFINPKHALFITLDLYSFIIFSLLIKLNLINAPNKFIAIINTNYDQVIKEKKFAFFRRILLYLTKYCFAIPNKIVFVSKVLQKFSVDKFKIIKPYQRSIVILNGISKWKMTAMNQSPSKPSCITIGRLENQKDFFTIIDALNIIKNKNNLNIDLKIIGKGSQKNKIFLYGKSKNITCKITGWVNEPRTLLKINDIFIFSSFFEGFGRVIVEAMSVGLPIIATDTPYGPAEILGKGKYGLLVPMQNPQVMAKAIIKLIKSKRLREKYNKLSLKRAAYFSEKKMLQKYNKLFQGMFRNKLM